MNDCRNCGNLEAAYAKGYRTALNDILHKLDEQYAETNVLLEQVEQLIIQVKEDSHGSND